MSDTRISQLPSPPSSLSGTEIMPIVQNGVTYAVPLQLIANLLTPSNANYVNITYSGLLSTTTPISYSDTNILAQVASSVNSYNQIILQNKSNGAAASANYNVSNDQGTATTNFGEFGINSSGFAGTGSFNQPGYAYLASGSTDLVIGTYSAKSIHFVVNSGITDAMSINGVSGGVVINTALSTPSIAGMTTPLSVAQGGTGSGTAGAALTALGAAASSEIGSLSGSYGYNASQALLANQIGMQLYFYGSTAGQTLTLPLRSATTIGNAFWFVNLASVPVTVASSGSDTLGISTPMQSFSYPASVVLQPGDSTCLVNDGFNWLEQQGVRAVNSPLIRAIGPAGYSATATIALSDLNRPIGGFPTAPITLTIPAGTTAGQSVTLTNFSQTAGAFITVSTTGAQRLYFQGLSGQTSIVLGLGDSVTLVFDGGNWIQVSGAAQFGIGQTWQSVVGSRVYGTTYTNTTGKTIAVSGYGTNVSSGALSVTVAGVQIFAVEAASGAPIVGYSFIVPPGGTYSITVTAGTVTNSVWAELR